MNNFEFKQNGSVYELTNGSVVLLTIPVADGAVDGADIGAMADMYNYTIDPYSVPQDGTYAG